ncbi:hypothetical protein AAK964_12270 [Tissierella praeacuta]|uniref:hypothetical protein n=1 Tax=Tissierella praeacuta TaxID=43131 RepID=UPI0035148075
MEDKINVFMGATLAEIKKEVIQNGRSIAEANLRLMRLEDDVVEIKELLQAMLKGE